MVLQLFWMVVVSIISYAIQAANAPKPQKPTAGNLDVPEPDPSRPVPVIFGTNIIKGANIIWYGNASAPPIKKKTGKK